MAQHHRRSHRKGRRGENELVKTLRDEGIDAERISVAGFEGPDVEAFNGRTIEVKRYEYPVSVKIPRWLEDVNMVAHKWNYGPWVIFITLDELLDLLDEAKQ